MENSNKLVTMCGVLFLLFFGSFSATAQTGSIRGVVYEAGTTNPIPFATVQILPHNIFTLTNMQGEFEFQRLDAARMQIFVQSLGKETIDTTLVLDAGQNLNLTFNMQTTSLQLQTVTVTAVENRAGASTSSVISRAALDHLQINSLAGIMQLLPGGMASNPNLMGGAYFNIRGISGTGVASQNIMNSLGTAIIMDGAPISTNANMQGFAGTQRGQSGLDDMTVTRSATDGVDQSIRGAGAGVDLRQISTDNIESIEVIRGIPSVEHGDLTAGAVHIRTRAGQEPLRVNARINPNIYEVSVSRGVLLGENRGGLNVSLNYAYGTQNLTMANDFFQRVNAQLTYSNTFFRNLNTTTIFSYTLGRDTRNPNVDDATVYRRSGASNNNFRLNTRGRWQFNNLWLTSINYTVSGDVTHQYSFHNQLLTNAQAPFTTSQISGTTLTSASQSVYDEDGNLIATSATQQNLVAIMLPPSYIESYEIHGRPVNVFANLTANFMRQFTPTLNTRLIVGSDFRSNGNFGDGLIFEPESSPFRPVAGLIMPTVRHRPFNDIPFVNQVGLFAETNILWNVFNRDINVRAGVRHDMVGSISATVPRINASFEIIPRVFSIRGGYGISAKAPTMIHLHPDRAFFDMPIYNQVGTGLPDAQRFVIISTYVFDAENPNLEMAKTRKAEVGFDLRIGQMSLSTTFFDEETRNGFRMGSDMSTFKKIDRRWYLPTAEGTPHIVRYDPTSHFRLLTSFNRPLNDATVLSRGFEFDFNTGRIDDIRTTFVFTGAYRRHQFWNNTYHFTRAVDGAAPIGAIRNNELHAFAWDPKLQVEHREMFSTNLRAIHNIPRLGFVVSLTTQVVWRNSQWTTFGDTTMPRYYISFRDGEIRPFTQEMYNAAREGLLPGHTPTEFSPALQSFAPNRTLTTPLSWRPYMLMNLHLSKELGELLTISFFANNMFSTHPLRESSRFAGSFQRMNNSVPLFFGVELRASIR